MTMEELKAQAQKETANLLRSVRREGDVACAERFLQPKGTTTTDYSIKSMARLVNSLADTKNPDGTIKYPYVNSLDTVDRAFLAQFFTGFHSAVNPEIYDLNFEAFVALYEKILSINYPVMQEAISKRNEQSIESGKEVMNTTQLNADLIAQMKALINSISYAKIQSAGVGVVS